MSRVLLWTDDERGSENSGVVKKLGRECKKECYYKRKFLGSKEMKCFNNEYTEMLGKECRGRCEKGKYE